MHEKCSLQVLVRRLQWRIITTSPFQRCRAFKSKNCYCCGGYKKYFIQGNICRRFCRSDEDAVDKGCDGHWRRILYLPSWPYLPTICNFSWKQDHIWLQFSHDDDTGSPPNGIAIKWHLPSDAVQARRGLLGVWRPWWFLPGNPHPCAVVQHQLRHSTFYIWRWATYCGMYEITIK